MNRYHGINNITMEAQEIKMEANSQKNVAAYQVGLGRDLHEKVPGEVEGDIFIDDVSGE